MGFFYLKMVNLLLSAELHVVRITTLFILVFITTFCTYTELLLLTQRSILLQKQSLYIYIYLNNGLHTLYDCCVAYWMLDIHDIGQIKGVGCASIPYYGTLSMQMHNSMFMLINTHLHT